MQTFTLVPNIPNPVVECHNLDLPPTPDGPWLPDSAYTTSTGHQRYVRPDIGPLDPLSLHFTDMMRNNVMPLLYSHERFNWSWPIKLHTLLDNTAIKVSLVKDEIGWYQTKHEDPRIFVISGVVHLQDCEQGTYFTDGNYTAPSKKFSGAFWLNSHWSHHEVPVVTSERIAYLLIAQWEFLHFHPGPQIAGKK